MKVTNEDREQAKTRLHEWLKPGDTVYTLVTHVSSTGMTRWIRLLIIRDNKPVDISWDASRVVGRPLNTRNHYGIETGGCGMDMGFELVYTLSRYLYPDGYDCLTHEPGESVDGVVQAGERKADAPEYGGCPANDHFNRNPVYHHSDGGYALNHEWL